MNPAGASMTSGSRSYSNAAGCGAYLYEVLPSGPLSYLLQRLSPDAIIFAASIVILIALIAIPIPQSEPIGPVFQLDSVSASPFNISISKRIVNCKELLRFDVGLTIINPNKQWRIHYDGFIIYVVSHGKNLGLESLLPFDQGKLKQIRMQVNFPVLAFVGDDAAQSMAADRSVGVMNIDVKVMGSVKFKFWEWETDWYLITSEIKNIKVSF